MGKRKRGSEGRRNADTHTSKRTKVSAQDEDRNPGQDYKGPISNAINDEPEDIQAHPGSLKQERPPHEANKGHALGKNEVTSDKSEGKPRKSEKEPVSQLNSNANHENHEASNSTRDLDSKGLSRKKRRRLSKQSKRDDGPLQASPPAQSTPTSAGNNVIPKEANSKKSKKNRRMSSQGQGMGSEPKSNIQQASQEVPSNIGTKNLPIKPSAQAGSLEDSSLADQVEVAAKVSAAVKKHMKRQRLADSHTTPINQNNSIPAINGATEFTGVREDISGLENDEKRALVSADSQDEYAGKEQREDDFGSEKPAIAPDMNRSSKTYKMQRTETDAERAARIAAKKATRAAKQERRREKQQFREINKASPSKEGAHADQQVTGRQSRRGKPKKKKAIDDSLWDTFEPEGGCMPGLDLGFGDNEKFEYTMSLGYEF